MDDIGRDASTVLTFNRQQKQNMFYRDFQMFSSGLFTAIQVVGPLQSTGLTGTQKWVITLTRMDPFLTAQLIFSILLCVFIYFVKATRVS